jgi:hypothetical protein
MLPHRYGECRVVHHGKNWPPMAELGQTRSSDDVRRMSALTLVSGLSRITLCGQTAMCGDGPFRPLFYAIRAQRTYSVL